jgi:hypothetical protein
VDTTSVQRETITRKALRLYPERTIEPLGLGNPGRYSVEGSDGFYEVDLGIFNGGAETCPCPARKPCYHIAMATIHRAKTTTRRRAEARARREARETVRANLAPLGEALAVH